MAYFRRQLEPCAETLGRSEEFARLGELAERAIELVDQSLAAALRQSFARQRQQLAHCRYANAFKKCAMPIADDAHGQLRQRQSAAAGTP